MSFSKKERLRIALGALQRGGCFYWERGWSRKWSTKQFYEAGGPRTGKLVEGVGLSTAIELDRLGLLNPSFPEKRKHRYPVANVPYRLIDLSELTPEELVKFDEIMSRLC